MFCHRWKNLPPAAPALPAIPPAVVPCPHWQVQFLCSRMKKSLPLDKGLQVFVFPKLPDILLGREQMFFHRLFRPLGSLFPDGIVYFLVLFDNRIIIPVDGAELADIKQPGQHGTDHGKDAITAFLGQNIMKFPVVKTERPVAFGFLHGLKGTG